MGRRLRLGAVGIAVALIAAGCSWGQYGHDGTRAAWSPAEKVLTPGNVAQLKPLWQTATHTSWGAQIDDGTVYSIDLTFQRLVAYQADGSVGCSGTSPRVCTPKWIAPLTMKLLPDDALHGGYAVAQDKVYVLGYLADLSAWRLEVFDAHGVQGCGGAPKTCAPLWSATFGTYADGAGSLAVANGRVYARTPTIPNAVTVFDANGVDNCIAGTPKTCAPLFQTAGVTGDHGFAVDDTHLVVNVNNGMQVFDALGVTGCGAGFCVPTRTYTTGGNPALAGNRLYSVAGGTDLSSAAGCTGSPPSCPFGWTVQLDAATVSGVTPAIAAGRLLVGESPLTTTGTAYVEAFDATGQQSCSGSPKVCTPLVQFDTHGGSTRGLGATGTLLFATTGATPQSPAKVAAWDLAGNTGCVGAPLRCVVLWAGLIDTSLVGNAVAPSIVNGVVAVSGNSGGIQTWAIPQP